MEFPDSTNPIVTFLTILAAVATVNYLFLAGIKDDFNYRFDSIDKKLDEQKADTNKRFDSIYEKFKELKDEFKELKDELKKDIKAGIDGFKEVFEVKFEAQEKILDAKIKN